MVADADGGDAEFALIVDATDIQDVVVLDDEVGLEVGYDGLNGNRRTDGGQRAADALVDLGVDYF